MADRLLTNEQVAEMLGVHPRTVAKWGKDGVLPAVQIAGSNRYKVIRFSEAAILEWMAQRPAVTG